MRLLQWGSVQNIIIHHSLHFYHPAWCQYSLKCTITAYFIKCVRLLSELGNSDNLGGESRDYLSEHGDSDMLGQSVAHSDNTRANSDNMRARVLTHVTWGVNVMLTELVYYVACC